MKISDIRNKLFELQDISYRKFIIPLSPNIPKEEFIGVRLPKLRALAKELIKDPDISEFLSDVPHIYHEERNLHAMIINEMKDYDTVISEINKWLPCVNAWSISDTLSPKVFKKHPDGLVGTCFEWLKSTETYTIRVGILILMKFYLDDSFDISQAKKISSIRSDEYYVNMMKAWYFATALAKQWDSIIVFLENRSLDEWTHNKSIQKAIESYRINDRQKEYLRSLKIKTTKGDK